jgi:hypothetical protein
MTSTVEKWEDWQQESLAIVCYISNSLSLIGCAFIIYCFLFLSKRNYFQKLIFYLSLANFFNALQWIISLATMNLSDYVCWICGPIKLYLYMCSFLWTAFIALEILLRLCSYKVTSLGEVIIPPHSRIKERYYHLIAWICPIPLAVPSLVQHLMFNGPYNCWYRPNNGWHIFFLALVVATLVYSIFIYILIIWKYCKVLSLHGAYSTDTAREAGLSRRVPFYILAFVICWGPPLISNFSEVVTSESSMYLFVAEMFSALLLPLTGWLNSIVYGWNRLLLEQFKLSVLAQSKILYRGLCCLCCCCNRRRGEDDRGAKEGDDEEEEERNLLRNPYPNQFQKDSSDSVQRISNFES